MKEKQHSISKAPAWRGVKRRIFSFFLFGFGFLSLLISQEGLKFEQFSIEDGLSQGTIFSILQDKRGFLWLGTEDGLNRYDGYEFKKYLHDPDDPDSLSNNKVWSICEDSAGVLWIGTGDGLNRFHRETETFVHYKKSDDANAGSLSNNLIRAIYEDKSGVLWLGTSGGGLNRFDRTSKSFKHYENEPEDVSSLSHNFVRVIYEDKAGVLWIGTEGGGLNRYNRDTESFLRYRHDPVNPATLSSDEVKTIFDDDSGFLLIGTDNGLNRMDRQKEVFFHYKSNPGDKWSLSHSYVYTIFEDDGGELWIGTYGGGLNRWDRKRNRFLHNGNSPVAPFGLSNNLVYSIYQDSGGILWVGTEDGLNKLDRKKKKFGGSDLVGDSSVWSIYKDKRGVVWIGTTEGLIQMDTETGKKQLWTNIPKDPRSLRKNNVLAIFEDRSGVLWIGTGGKGLNRFDRQRGIFIRFECKNAFPGCLSNNRIYAIYEDNSEMLWLGTRKGLKRINRETGNFNCWKHEPENLDSLSNDWVTSIYQDRGGELWIGTKVGLNRFNPEKDTFTTWKKEKNNPGSLSDNHITRIYEDKAGTLWIGTGVGLNKFDREKWIFTHYTSKDGLPNNKVNGILEDEKGCLWLSTNGGISRFNPEMEEFRNYDVHDGLQSNEFNGNSCYKSSDGEMFFGGMKGFNYFFPNEIKNNPHQPPIVITDFRILNEPVGIGSDSPLKQSITETKEITLSHSHLVFSFDFAAVDFSTPIKNKYKYKMVGFDKKWQDRDAKKRFATYTNLDPGEYTFTVIGSNNDGIWNNEGVSIAITITPPFWKTWWFRIAMGILVIILLFAGYRYRTRRLRDKLASERRVQEILRKSRDLAEFRRAEIEKLITAISSLLIAVDSDGKVFQWNDTAEKFFGIPGNQCIGGLFSNVLQEYISDDKLDRIIEKGLGEGAGKPFSNYEIPIDLKGKGTRLLMAIINPIVDRGGRKLGFLLLAEDVTHHKEEERRRHLSQKLESLGQMAGNIAHEIKTPLQYIGHNGRFVSDSFGDIVKFYRTVSESLEELEQSDKKNVAERIKQIIADYDIRYVLEEVPKASGQIVEGVSTVSNIIQSMKEYCHPGRGVMEKADVNKLLETTVVIVRNKIKKTLDIEPRLSGQLPPVPCYPGELNQVFMNLLSNAADAIQEKGELEEPGLIKITTVLLDNEVVISIEDNGGGIPDNIRDNVFNPFFTTKDVGKGTGQGLSMAHNIIIEKHKGKLYFKSKMGIGTSFYIHLPVQGES